MQQHGFAELSLIGYFKAGRFIHTVIRPPRRIQSVQEVVLEEPYTSSGGTS
jgi:hypothetical protein